MNEAAQTNNISLYLTTKGKYHWSISLAFATIAGAEDKDVAKQIVDSLTAFDKELRKQFPINTADKPLGRSGFVPVNEFEDKD